MANETFIQAGEILLKTKEALRDLFSDPLHASIALMAEHQLDQLINRFHFLGGSAPVVTPTEQFPPITSFMGEEITRKEVKPADVIPASDEKQIYIDKVEKLYDTFPQMHADTILNSYTIPEDVLVLRGVAKKAGVKNYHNKSLTVQFIEEIKEGIAAKAAEAEEKRLFEEELAKKKGGTTVAE
jgi:hypothetical protein